jgi:hypothetical protein
MTPEEFLKFLPLNQSGVAFLIGTIPASYSSGRPTITFDGESTASTRTYPYLNTYTPTAEDRVLIAVVGHSGVVLGKIT